MTGYCISCCLLRFPLEIVPENTNAKERRVFDSPEALREYLRANKCSLGRTRDMILESLCNQSQSEREKVVPVDGDALPRSILEALEAFRKFCSYTLR